MDENIEILTQTSLFRDIVPKDIRKLIECTNAKVVIYEKNEMVLWEDNLVTNIGIVLSGYGRSFKMDVSGKETIITFVEKGNFIGVLLAVGRDRKSPVSVQAVEQMSVVYIPFDKIIKPCVKGCSRHTALIINCFDSIAEKSLILLDRIDCLIRPTLREKIMAYLTQLAKHNNSQTFMMPLDRKAMSEYLSTDRSALSRELARMKHDGLIDYYKSSFKIYFGPAEFTKTLH